jgi:beta-phosphoglucomutase-like phosphatase (HAD superfamily)
VDIDGVVADARHRLAHLAVQPKDWDGFFAAAVNDPVLPEGQAVVRQLVESGHEIVWLTGRPERCRQDTVRWLGRHDLPAGRLFMRGDRDRRPARVTKLDALRKLATSGRIAVMVDDDAEVVRTLRAAGFNVLHADWMLEAPPDQPTTSADQHTAAQLLFDAQEVEGRT